MEFIKIVVTFCSFLSLISGDIPSYSEKYFEQILDHFNYYTVSSQPSTFRQRYLVQGRSSMTMVFNYYLLEYTNTFYLTSMFRTDLALGKA